MLSDLKSLRAIHFQYNDGLVKKVEFADAAVGGSEVMVETKTLIFKSIRGLLMFLVWSGGWKATRAWLMDGGKLPQEFVERARSGGWDEDKVQRLEQLSMANLR